MIKKPAIKIALEEMADQGSLEYKLWQGDKFKPYELSDRAEELKNSTEKNKFYRDTVRRWLKAKRDLMIIEEE